MRRIFVCSPLRGDIVGNIERCRRLCHEVVKFGQAPYAPHIFYTQFLDDNDEIERAKGIACGEMFLEVCDELWAWAPEGKISTGMRFEIDLATRLGKPVILNPVCWEGIK